jgi:hypothetical protein
MSTAHHLLDFRQADLTADWELTGLDKDRQDFRPYLTDIKSAAFAWR